MIPLFQIFGRTFSIYTILALCGVLAALFTMYRLAVRDKLDEIEMIVLVLLCFAGSFLGGMLLKNLWTAINFPTSRRRQFLI